MVESDPENNSKKQSAVVEILRPMYMSDFEGDPDVEDLHLGINREKTDELQAMPKY
jgi:hypothetical protein